MQNAGFSEKLDAKQIDHKSGPEESDAEINRPEDGTEHKKNQHKQDKKTRSDHSPGEPEDFQCDISSYFTEINHDLVGQKNKDGQ